MQIGILGTGIVGQTLGIKLVQLGHSVILGTRDPSKLDEPKGWDPDSPTLHDWLRITGAQGSVGTFREAATCGDVVINALSGAASLEVLQAVGEEHMDGKTLIDVSNPMDFSQGFPPTLFVKDTDSLGEMLQREFPNVRVVKTLNATMVDLMVNPQLVGNGDHTVFLSGNDPQAKAEVTQLLQELGWHDILDLGDISTARGPEMMFAIAHSAMRALSPARTAFKVVR